MKIQYSPSPALLGLALSSFTALSFFAHPAQAAPPAGYTQIWADEFNTSSLDTNYWNYSWTGPYRDGYNTPNAVDVGGGNLTITAYTENGVHYTGHLDTKGKYQPKYGYMESRIQFSNAPGNWSAFWMWVATVGATNQPHTDGVEMDIVEHRQVNQAGTVISDQIPSTLHWDGYGANHKSVSSGLRGAGLSSGFHTYGMEWTPDYYKFYIDGAYLYTVNNSTDVDPIPPAAPVSQRSQQFMLSTEVQTATWAGNIPSGGYGPKATSTSKMLVDYVRCYQLNPSAPAVPTLALANVNHRAIKLSWNMVDNATNYEVKRALTAGGPYTTIGTGVNVYTDSNVVPGTTYYYVVSALNGTVASANSNQVSASPLPSDTHSGNWAARVTLLGNSSYYAIRRYATVATNTNYVAGVWIKGTGRLHWGIRRSDGSWITNVYLNASANWTYYEVPFNSGSESQVLFYLDDSSTIAGTVYVDDTFIGPSGGTNLLQNPGFESGNTGWTIYQPQTWQILQLANTRTGLWSSRGTFGASASFHNFRQTLNVAANTSYTAGLWMKGTGRARLIIRQTGGTAIASQYITATPDWTYYSLPFNSGANSQLVFYLDDSTTTAGTVYVDDTFLGISGGANLLADPGFEAGGGAWTFSSTAIWKPDQF